MRISIAVVLFSILLQSCASHKFKDVTYLEDSENKQNPKLNVFIPKRAKGKKLPVLIFIHGGNWNTGNKDTYGFYGRNFAKKDVVVVIPDYTLSPKAGYDVMADQMAKVILWTKENIAQYQGDPNQIFVTGHSAGGHLAALAVMNPKYGIKPGTVSGIVLNDAAGLDMKHYLNENPPEESNDYISTWTTDPEKWKDASPIYFLNKNTPPFLIYTGSKTYESIKTANARFLKALQPLQPNVKPIVLNKKHIPMILQYFWPWNDRFDETVKFMKAQQ